MNKLFRFLFLHSSFSFLLFYFGFFPPFAGLDFRLDLLYAFVTHVAN